MYFKTTSLSSTCPHLCVCAVNWCPAEGYKSGRVNLVSCPLPHVGCQGGGPESSDCGSCCFSSHISLPAMWRALLSLLLPASRVVSLDSSEHLFPATTVRGNLSFSFTEAMETACPYGPYLVSSIFQRKVLKWIVCGLPYPNTEGSCRNWYLCPTAKIGRNELVVTLSTIICLKYLH